MLRWTSSCRRLLCSRLALPTAVPRRLKTLVIVESATKAKTIQKYLHDDYIVDSSCGHIRDLSSSNSGELVSPHLTLRSGHLGFDVHKDFKPKYKITNHDVVARLKEHLLACDALVLATDADREGEAIAWHLVEVLQPKIPVSRVVIHEITEEAVLRAISSPRSIDMALVEAQETRRILDRLIGYTLTPVLWREIERWKFHPSVYYSINAAFTTPNLSLDAKLVEVNGSKVVTDEVLQNKSQKAKYTTVDVSMAHAVIDFCKDHHKTFRVQSIVDKRSQRQAPSPFITSTLQQEAVTRLNFSPTKTMIIAQSLYERGYITYMRTDNAELSEEGRLVAQATVKEKYGDNYVRGAKKKSKANAVRFAQLAHEAIRPATHKNAFLSSSELEGSEKKLYEMIYDRTLASVMAHAEMKTTTVVITAEAASDTIRSIVFRASQSEYTFDGFRAALSTDESLVTRSFSQLKADDVLNLEPTSAFHETHEGETASIRCKRHTTQPPARYTDGSFIRELEANGIGRPSTYALVLPKLNERDFIINDGHTIVPTIKGMTAAQLLHQLFPTFVDCKFTASMESNLDQIAAGEMDKVTLLRDYYWGSHLANGLLHTVESVLKDCQQVGSKDQFRELNIPCIADIGKIVYYREVSVLSALGGSRWFLTPAMQRDIRLVTRDAIVELMRGSPVGSQIIGKKQVNDIDQDVKLCTGRFGLYLEVGKRKTKQYKIYNVPAWVTSTALPEQLLEFTSLPMKFGVHKPTGKNIVLDVRQRQLSVGLEGYENCIPLPEFVYPSQVTLEQCLEILGDGSSLEQVSLGVWNHSPIKLKRGRFGYFLDCAGVRSFVKAEDVPHLTPEKAVYILEAKVKHPRLVARVIERVLPKKSVEEQTSSFSVKDDPPNTLVAAKERTSKQKTSAAPKKTVPIAEVTNSDSIRVEKETRPTRAFKNNDVKEERPTQQPMTAPSSASTTVLDLLHTSTLDEAGMETASKVKRARKPKTTKGKKTAKKDFSADHTPGNEEADSAAIDDESRS